MENSKLICDVSFIEEVGYVIIYIADEETAKEGTSNYEFTNEQYQQYISKLEQYKIFEMQEGIFESADRTVEETEEILKSLGFECRHFMKFE